MLGTLFYPLSRLITAAAVFFGTLFSGGGIALGTPAPSLATPAWPAWVHEHWVWENDGTQESALAFVEGFTQRGIPVGCVVIDRPWATDCTTFIPDPETYPDLGDYVKKFHDRGVRIMLWATSMVNETASNYQEGLDNGYFLSGGKTVKWWAGHGALLDYDNPAAVAWWHKQMDQCLDMGIDGWKIDGSDPYVITLLPALNYQGRYVTWRHYREQTYGDFFNYTRQRLGNDRVITARPVDDQPLRIGIPIVSTTRDINFAGWVGDQDNGWAGLRHALNNMFTASWYNFVSYGSDIGGFRNGDTGDEPRRKDVFLRWAELGAFCPVMENGGGGGEHAPWKFDEETTDIYRKFTLLHHALIPYIYSQAAYSYERSLPTMRPQTGMYEYLLGDDILVAPYYKDGARRTVTFPLGDDWVYLFDESKIYKGGGIKTFETPLDELPVFVRKGALIPYQDGEVTNARVYAPQAGTHTFGLYEEDRPGCPLSYTLDGNVLTFKTGPTERPLLWQADVPRPQSVRSYGVEMVTGGTPTNPVVLTDNVPLPQAASLEALKTFRAGGGYYYADGQLWVYTPDARAEVRVTL